MPEGQHECIQAERLKLIETDLREARKIMNGKFDRLTADMNAGIDKIWRKLDGVATQQVSNKINTAKNKYDIKWIVLLLTVIASIIANFYKG